MHTNRSSSRVAIGGAIVALSLALGGNAAAQWEFVYGATGSIDNGARGVAPVRFCPNPGFVAVGTAQPTAAANSDVYLVRTTVAGGPIFERRYDIAGVGAADHGNAIVELSNGTGFVITGSTTVNGGVDDVFLLRVDCNGNVIWAFTYGSPLREAAMDLIEASSGNAAAGTAAGDLVAAGFATNPVGGNSDG